MFFRAQIMRLVHPKYFQHDRVDFKPIAFREILKNTTHDISQDRKNWILTLHFNGEDRPTKIALMKEFDPSKPSLIYHHGAGAINPQSNFNRFFDQDFTSNFNVFIIHASHHETRKDYLENSVDSFLHHQLTFAGSVLATDEIIKYHRHHSDQIIIDTGTSMGGIVASLHAFYFGTADYYFPIVAYPNVGEIFGGKAYKTITKDWEEKRKIGEYAQSFDIKEFDHALTKKVFPILGEADAIVPFTQANTFWIERGFEVKVFPYGHFTPGIVPNEIRDYIKVKSMAKETL